MGIRFTRFNAVSALGFAVQLAVLSILLDGAGVHYLPATVLAVSAAILHNFVWHTAWTWADRHAGRAGHARAFTRFVLSNGVVSLVGNTAIMAVLVGRAGMPPFAANVAAIVCCGVVNFLLADRFVFQRPEPV